VVQELYLKKTTLHKEKNTTMIMDAFNGNIIAINMGRHIPLSYLLIFNFSAIAKKGIY